MFNKKTIIIIICTIAAVSIGITAISLAGKPQTSELPVVNENNPTTAEPKTFVANAPTDGIDVSGIKDTESTADADARDKALESQGSITQDDAALKADAAEQKKTQDALNNPQPKTDPVKGVEEDVKVTVPQKKPEPTPTPAPKKDADGYIVSKAQAIKDGAAALQNAIDTKYFAWTDTYTQMKEEFGYTDEQIQALINKAKNDPYSSTILTLYYNDYRKDGDKMYLVGCIIAWINNGGNDDGYNGSGV